MAVIQRAQSLREQAYGWLKEQLQNGLIAPGERLTEASVAQRLGISRTPTREALSLLVQDGLLEGSGAGGYSAPRLTEADVSEIFEIRQQLEPYAIGLLAQVVEDASVAALEAIVSAEEESISEFECFVQANAKFRDALFSLIPNGRLGHCIREFEGYVAAIRKATLTNLSQRELAVFGHRSILQALKMHNRKMAEQAMHLHLENAHQAYAAVVADRDAST